MYTLLPIAIVSAAALAPVAPPQPSAAPLTPVQNVLMIVLDDVGAEYLDWWPQGPTAMNPPDTSEMKAIATAGVIFSNYYSQPLCSPARAEIMSGRSAFETGMGQNPDDTEFLATSWNSPNPNGLPAILSSTAGYACGAFGKWHLGAIGDWMHPIHEGFDLFDGTESNVAYPTSTPATHHFNWWNVEATAAGATRKLVAGPVNDESVYSLSVTGRAARQWISQQTGSYFAYVAFNVPHGPFQVPPHTLLKAATIPTLPAHFVAGYKATSLAERQAIYRLAIEALDTEIGRLVAVVNPSNTMVLVVGDNGTPQQAVDMPWHMKAKGTVYAGGVRVPMFVRGPVTQFPNTVCTRLVSALDMRPTVVSLASGTLPFETPAATGVDFTSLIKNPNASPVRFEASSQRFGRNGPYTPSTTAPAVKQMHDRSISNGSLHYLRKDFVPVTGAYTEEAYDLAADPLSTNDLLGPNPIPAPTAAQLVAIQALRDAMTQESGL